MGGIGQHCILRRPSLPREAGQASPEPAYRNVAPVEAYRCRQRLALGQDCGERTKFNHAIAPTLATATSPSNDTAGAVGMLLIVTALRVPGLVIALASGTADPT